MSTSYNCPNRLDLDSGLDLDLDGGFVENTGLYNGLELSVAREKWKRGQNCLETGPGIIPAIVFCIASENL
jgi:hypothetical protein